MAVAKAQILASEGRYGANMDRHHDFVCTECERVRDVYSETLDELPLPKSVASLGRVESAHVQLRGTCSTCARRTSDKHA